MGGAASAPAIAAGVGRAAAAAGVAVETCVANIVLCANRAGMAVADILAGEALGSGTVAGGTAAATVGRMAANKIDLIPPPNTYVVYPRGIGAADGPLPEGYTTVSRWVSPGEASLWVQNQETAIPVAIPRNGTPQLYVTEAGASYPPGAIGTVRIYFAVPDTMLRKGNSISNYVILQPSSSTQSIT